MFQLSPAYTVSRRRCYHLFTICIFLIDLFWSRLPLFLYLFANPCIYLEHELIKFFSVWKRGVHQVCGSLLTSILDFEYFLCAQILLSWTKLNQFQGQNLNFYAGSKASLRTDAQVGINWLMWCIGASISRLWEWRGKS